MISCNCHTVIFSSICFHEWDKIALNKSRKCLSDSNYIFCNRLSQHASSKRFQVLLFWDKTHWHTSYIHLIRVFLLHKPHNYSHKKLNIFSNLADQIPCTLNRAHTHIYSQLYLVNTPQHLSSLFKRTSHKYSNSARTPHNSQLNLSLLISHKSSDEIHFLHLNLCLWFFNMLSSLRHSHSCISHIRLSCYGTWCIF